MHPQRHANGITIPIQGFRTRLGAAKKACTPRLVVNTDDLTSFIYSSSFLIERIWNLTVLKMPAFRLNPWSLPSLSS